MANWGLSGAEVVAATPPCKAPALAAGYVRGYGRVGGAGRDVEGACLPRLAGARHPVMECQV